MTSTVNREIGKLGLPRHLVLGMDPGIASCGFALIDINNHEILEIGVRLFDSPTHPKTGQSLAVIRRGFRSTRRNIDRTQARLKHCLEVLKKHGVIPPKRYERVLSHHQRRQATAQTARRGS